MGQYADQFILDSHDHTVENVMELLLDIALTVLGALGQGHKSGKALGRLYAPKEIALVTVDRNLAHLQLADIVAEGKLAIIQIAEQLRILLQGKVNCPNEVRFCFFIKFLFHPVEDIFHLMQDWGHFLPPAPSSLIIGHDLD